MFWILSILTIEVYKQYLSGKPREIYFTENYDAVVTLQAG